MTAPAPGLAVVGATLDGQVVGLRAEGGTIVALGPDVAAAPGDEVVEAGGMAVVPGMVNAHTHAPMTLLRSYGDGLPLMEWLETRIWPAEAGLTPDDVYWGARLACLEMVRSGTTCFADMYWHAPEVARAADDAGVRALVADVLFDGGPAGGPDAHDDLRALAEASVEALGERSDLVTPFLGPHAVYTVSPRSLGWVADAAERWGLGLHVHLSETEGEVARCVEATGLRPTDLLDRCGLLGPRTLLAHGCWLEPDELDLVAERGATLVAVPASNLKLATGRTLPVAAARAAGADVALGTDGTASNNALDLFADVKLLALLATSTTGDPGALPAAEALAVARGQRSSLLGGRPLAVGGPADLLLVRSGDPELRPGDLDANLVYAASGAVVDTTVVAGRVLMRGRHVEGADEVVAQAVERATRLRGAP